MITPLKKCREESIELWWWCYSDEMQSGSGCIKYKGPISEVHNTTIHLFFM